MNKKDLTKLVEVADLIYQQDLSVMKQHIAEEMRIRTQLARLIEQETFSWKILSENVVPTLVGADVAWAAFVASSRRDLNLDLAATMAKKLNERDALRISYGRREAIKAIAMREEKAALRKIGKTLEDRERQATSIRTWTLANSNRV